MFYAGRPYARALPNPEALAPRPVKVEISNVVLTVNGEARSFETLSHLVDLVSALGLDGRKVAIERNLEIVPRSAYGKTKLSDGDRIEIVHFIGGG